MIYYLFILVALLIMLVIGLYVALRLARVFVVFPMPSVYHSMLDSIVRHYLKPEDSAALHKIESGNKVLEIGPRHADYTMAAIRAAGTLGCIHKFDAEKNASSLSQLPFEDGSLDVVYSICCFGKLQDKESSLLELKKALKQGGLLVLSECFYDIDYSFANTLIQTINMKGFRLENESGNMMFYTLVFKRTG